MGSSFNFYLMAVLLLTNTYGLTTLVCGQRFCPELDLMANVTITYDNGSRPEGTIATYNCSDGLYFAYNSGNVERTCQNNSQWSGSAPSCGVPCPVLTVTNGGVIYRDNYGHYVTVEPSGYPGTRATNVRAIITCHPNYTLVGPSTRICQSDGVWNRSTPTCSIYCPVLSITNGTVAYDSGSSDVRPVGTVATHSCESGFSFAQNHGNKQRICQNSTVTDAGGQWTGSAPVCRVPCPVLPEPTNGRVSYNPSQRPVNAIATYTCDQPDYILVGDSTRICQPSSVWSGSEPTCSRFCPELDLMANVTITYDNGSRPEGTIATYNCSDGLYFAYNSGNVERTCQNNSQWSGSAPSCGVPCSILTVTNGGVTYRDNNGHYVTVEPPGYPMTKATNVRSIITCHSGYTLVGPSTRICQSNGVWNGSTPTCSTICPDLAPIANGTITYNSAYSSESSSVRPVGIEATYSCIAGFFLAFNSGNVKRVCQNDQQWSGSAPSCGVPCPVLTVTNGLVSYIDSFDLPVEESPPGYPETKATNVRAIINCNHGYTLVGPSTRTCQSEGTWNGSETICPAVDCGDPPELTNGMVTVKNTTFGSTATYSCNSKYILTGFPSNLTCQASGLWNSSMMNCVVLCPQNTFSNGMVTYSMSGDPPSVGTVATYSCVTGYELTGNETRTCEEGTGWSGSLPICTIVDCGLLTDPLNGQVNLPSGTTFNQVANYSCNIGYLFTGDKTRTCWSNGVWSSTEPSCKFILLSIGMSLYTTNNSEVNITTIGEGSSALTCHTELTSCCREQDNSGTALGQWVGPDSKQIVESNSLLGFYVTRQQSSISLNFRENSTQPGGSYCCTVPRTGGVNSTVCVKVISPFVPDPGTAMSEAAIGGAVTAVIVILAITIIVTVVVMFLLRHKSRRDSQQKSYAPRSSFILYTKKGSHDNGAAIVRQYEEPTISGFPSETHAVEGEEVCLRVKVGGHPPPTITWYRDGKEVTPDYATEIYDDGTLTFPCVEAKHTGVYRVVASGPSGSAEKLLTLTVTGEDGEGTVEGVDYAPIPEAQFGTFIVDLHANNNAKFGAYYNGLSSREDEHTTTIAKGNRDFNRFGNILVYDDNRIVLQPIPDREDCQSDYINASYVNGYSIPNKFLASQGPLPHTLVDFWRLVWQERPPIIVMLTNLKEGNKIKCQQYWPDSGSVEYGPFTVTITDQQVLTDYTVRTLSVHVEGQRKVYMTTQYHFTSWPDHGVPEYATPILGIHRRVRSKHNPSKGPLLVHCSAGVGRTGTYIVIDNVLDQIAAEGVVDISGAIVKARNQRMKLVQTQNQYVFIHDAVLESVTCGDTQINAGDLRRQIQKLSQKAQGKDCTGFQYQFQILEQVSPDPIQVNCYSARKHTDRNRGNKYLPAENHRVLLEGESTESNYINAVFANGYKHQKAYIIAQNPLPSTVRNFWKVIYDRKCSAVVMLTPLRENGEEVCSRYWPEREGVTSSYGEYTVDNLGEESNPGFIIRQLRVLSRKAKQAHQVTQFQILNWNRNGECSNLITVVNVNEEVTKIQRKTGNNPILVQCDDTATRSGMYCAIATTIDRCKAEGVVDVFQVVKALRVHKPGAVTSVDNYKEIFDGILEYLDSFDTYANFI